MSSNLHRVINVVRLHIYLYLLLLVTVSMTFSSFLILKFESGYPDSQIRTIHDAIWWSAIGISTIGIGPVVPESTAGRYLTLFLMVVGVIIFSLITAKIASIFTEEEIRQDLDKDLKVIESDLNKVEKDIEGEVAVDDRKLESDLAGVEKRLKRLEKRKHG